MAARDSEPRQQVGSRAGAGREPPARRLRIAGPVLTLAFALVLILGGGFIWFVWHIPNTEVVLERRADGIVVLTGGSSRIADAVELLANGHGQRLLITGAHPATTTREIARLMPNYQRLLSCCVDVDHSAMNTVGNAIETRRWAQNRNFRSLIIVTSAYHMPRSLAELERQLPDRELIPFPVVSDRLRAEPWWSTGATAKLVVSEYLKYLYAQVRMRLGHEAERAAAISASRRG